MDVKGRDIGLERVVEPMLLPHHMDLYNSWGRTVASGSPSGTHASLTEWLLTCGRCLLSKWTSDRYWESTLISRRNAVFIRMLVI